MSATGKQPLAQVIVTLWIALEGVEASDDVSAIFAAVQESVGAAKPRVALNRRFAQLRRARPEIFHRLLLWIERPEVKETARRTGALWAWKIWRQAIAEIHRGTKAHAAFGMDIGGRPKNSGFTLAEDAAIYAIHAIHSGQAPDEGGAVQLAATIYQARIDSIQKALPLARSLRVSDLAAAVLDSSMKRK